MLRIEDDDNIEILQVQPAEPFLTAAIYPFLQLMRLKQRESKVYSFLPRHLVSVTVDAVEVALSGLGVDSIGIMAPTMSFVKYPDTPLSVVVTVCGADSAAAQAHADESRKELARITVSPTETPAAVEAAKRAVANAAAEVEAASAAVERAGAEPTEPPLLLGKGRFGSAGAAGSKLLHMQCGESSVTVGVAKEYHSKPLTSIVLPFLQSVKVQAGHLSAIHFQTEGAQARFAIGAEQIARALAAPTRTWLTAWSAYTSIVFHAADAPMSVDGFVAADAFEGAKSGKVFKMGSAGLGYYPDKWATLSVSDEGLSVGNSSFDMED